METCLLNQWEMVQKALHEGNVHEANIAALKYRSDLEHYFELNSGMVKLYENDIEKLEMRQSEDPLSTSQKEQILNEVKELECLCSIGLKLDGDISQAVDDGLFRRLLENVKDTCPLIYSILQCLLVSDTRKRVHKSPDYKMKCGINALALLLSVRNQKFNNDVRLVFGLLCISYGAGKQFVNLLHKIGLTPHWDTM